MPNELPLPPELEHLLEKREGTDRRQRDRRKTDALQSEPPPGEAERRSGSDRRQQARRDEDRPG